MKLEEKIKEQIKKFDIKPKSKWSFVLKEWFIWILGILSVIIGSLIVSATLFYIKNTHWGIYVVTNDNIFDFLLEFLPFVWIALFVSFVFLTYKFLNKTKKGYKYNFVVISTGVLVLSIFMGVIDFEKGTGFIIENKIGSRIPFYKSIESKEREVWNDRENGLFLGVITKNEDTYYLQTKDGLLVIDMTDLPESFSKYFDFDEDNDEMVRIAGKLTEEETIYPCMIFPFEIVEDQLFGGPKLKLESEINPSEMRINNCKDVRPYMKLKAQ